MSIEATSHEYELQTAQIAKLRAETAKLGAEIKKIEADTVAVPHVATGSYRSELVKTVGAIIFGIGGAVAATSSFIVAKHQVELAEYKSAQANERAKGAEAAASAASIAEANAIKRRDDAKIEEAVALKNADELRTVLSEQTAQVQKSQPQLLQRQLVYVQFQGGLNRILVNELRASLEKNGYSAPGAERIEGGYRSLVKYFRTEDGGAATALAKTVEQFFNSKGCPIQITSVQATATSAVPPLELWLAHSCKA